jgi:hypothetical protein
MNYETALADQAAAEQKAQRDEQNARAWHAILAKYPLRDSQANYSMLLLWANPLSLEAFEELLRSRPAGLTLDAVSRESLIEEIVKNSSSDLNSQRSLRLRLSTNSLGQLREKRREQEFRATVKTKDQAKAFLANAHQDNSWKGTGMPRLHSSIVPPGEVAAVKTGDFLRKIARSDAWLLKRYVKIYGADQINWWLQN